MLYEIHIPDAVLYWDGRVIRGVIDCNAHKFYAIRPDDLASFNVFIGLNDQLALGTTLDKIIENMRVIGKHLNLTIHSTYMLSQTGFRSYTIERSSGMVPKMELEFEDPIDGWLVLGTIKKGVTYGLLHETGIGPWGKKPWGYISDFNDDVGDGYKVNLEARVIPEIKNVIIADPYTTILWKDGTKTQVKCMEGDRFDPEHGFAMAVLKKYKETKEKPNAYSKWVKDWVKKGLEAGHKQFKKKNSKRGKKEDGCGEGMCSWSYDEDGNIVKGED